MEAPGFIIIVVLGSIALLVIVWYTCVYAWNGGQTAVIREN